MNLGRQSCNVGFYTFLRTEKNLTKTTTARYMQVLKQLKDSGLSEMDYYIKILDDSSSAANKRAPY